ncbi:MAG: PDZ domain-containing protein [Deltaproteobacteria bacterium]|nr:PDZ domain-containing protein [Deltaproteobacteria bacterium]
MLISQTPVGSQVNVDLIRKGNKKTVSVQVGELEKAEQEITQAKKVSNELGLGVRDVGAEEAAALGLKEAKGVLVVRVAPQSQAEYVGIQSGDLILGINDLKVNNLAEYTQALSKIQTGSILRVFVKRGNATSFFAFKK